MQIIETFKTDTQTKQIPRTVLDFSTVFIVSHLGTRCPFHPSVYLTGVSLLKALHVSQELPVPMQLFEHKYRLYLYLNRLQSWKSSVSTVFFNAGLQIVPISRDSLLVIVPSWLWWGIFLQGLEIKSSILHS